MNKNQDYDKIIRESVERVIPTIIEKLCGLHPEKLSDLPTSFQRTLERRPDFLKKALVPHPAPAYIIHIEFQTSNDREMVKRMLDHYALLYGKYELVVRQFVIFIGPGKARMPTQIPHPELQFRFNLINLGEIDCELFINSAKPEEIILGILADFKGKPSVHVIQSILQNLRKYVKSARSLRTYCTQLEILAQLRNLQPLTVQQIEAMPFTYDITADIRYQKGIEQGIEKNTRKIVEKLLADGEFPLGKIAEIADVSIDFVIQIQNELTQNNRKGKK